MSKIIDITGKKFINCTECGFAIDVPPREASIEKLRHMRDVKRVSEALKKTEVERAVANPMILICPQCSHPIVCRDEFTKS